MSASATVEVTGIAKSFGSTEVLSDVSLAVPAGSVTALLGPSGCGKTTALRIIAGLETPDRGTVSIGGDVVTGDGVDVPTERRRVGMIFQNGALFPHMSVARNVGYGLDRPQRKGSRRIDEMLELVGLSGLGERSPDSLSGGQAQRVALARALAPEPAVVLMDEPFSNLDALLRARLRREVADVVRAAGVTVLLVTHDRDEAFSLADHVAVMRDGRIAQVGTPRTLYERPIDPWVAAFVGDANLLPAVVDSGMATTSLGSIRVGDGDASSGLVLVRPEEVLLSVGPDGGGVAAVVSSEKYLGSVMVVEVAIGGALLSVSVAGGGPSRGVGSKVFVRRRPDLGPAVLLRDD